MNRIEPLPSLLILNQMAGPMTRELVEDLADEYGVVELLTGHPDTLAELQHPGVVVTPSVPYVRGSLMRRLLTWIRYLLHAAIWLGSRPREIPVLVFSNPPLLPWLAAMFHRLRGTRYAVIVHDIYPDVVVRQRVLSDTHLLTRCWRWCNRCSYQHASVVITLGRHMATTLQRQFDAAKTAAGHLVMVPPWADRSRLHTIPKTSNAFAIGQQLVDRFTVGYSGNMGLGHDLESILRAARSLRDQQDHVRFLFVGDGPKWKWLNAELSAYPEPHVTLLPWVSEAELPFVLASVDLAIVSQETELSQLAVPSKAYYFLAAGVPIIALCQRETELAELVEEYHCGIVLPPGHPDLLQRALTEAVSNPVQMQTWRHGANSAAEVFDRRRQVESLISILDQYLAPASRETKKQLSC